jgi:hypothetical protein
MGLNIWASIHAALARFWVRLNPRPDNSQHHREKTQTEESPATERKQPATDVLHAEWSAFQAFIREIHQSERQHQKAERELGAAQLTTAKGLNRVTPIGAICGAVGSIGIIGSLIIAKEAAHDARTALTAVQRPLSW